MRQVFVTLFILATHAIVGQSDINGDWKGAIKVSGLELDIALSFWNDLDTLKGALDIPVQGIKALPLEALTFNEKKVAFKLPSSIPGNAHFEGIYDGDADIKGDFKQGGMAFPLMVTRLSAIDEVEAQKKLAEQLVQIETMADSFRIARNHPGLALAIVKDGKVILSKGFGHSHEEKQTPVNDQTLFAIGSCTKAFTAAGVAMLVDDGALEWDAPIVKYLPDFKMKDDFASREMNAIDLLSHRSGLPRHDLLWYGSALTREEMYHRLRYLEPNKSFRTTWQYQNLMYMTAGILIERLSGKSWESFTQDRIFDPLGMTGANFSIERLKNHPNAALPYKMDDNQKPVRMEYRNIDAIGPAGSINASVEDMAKWVKTLLNKGETDQDRIIAEATFQQLHTAHMPMNAANNAVVGIDHAAYGLGWMIYQHKNIKVIEHGGNIDGFSALVWLVPNENIGIVALTNVNGSGLPGVVARTATDILLMSEMPTNYFELAYGAEKDKMAKKALEEKESFPRIDHTTPNYSLDQYAGQYEHPAYGVVNIQQLGDSLVVRYNFITERLTHWHYEVFNVHLQELEDDIKIQFSDNKQGRVIGLRISLDAAVEDIEFKKLPSSKQSDPDYLKLLTGKYELTGQTVEIKVNAKNLLTASLPGQPEYTLEPFQDHEFTLKGLNGFSVEFLFEKTQKRSSGLRFIQPNGVFSAKRVD